MVEKTADGLSIDVDLSLDTSSMVADLRDTADSFNSLADSIEDEDDGDTTDNEESLSDDVVALCDSLVISRTDKFSFDVSEVTDYFDDEVSNTDEFHTYVDLKDADFQKYYFEKLIENGYVPSTVKVMDSHRDEPYLRVWVKRVGVGNDPYLAIDE